MQLYAIFHLNLFYSSIEETQRCEVLRCCYWPLLRLAQDLNIPLGLEASGHTLEIAADLDPKWVEALRHLVREGPCEWLGSGYTQLIGPLVPAQVNAKNLQFGHEVYERLLGIRPKVAFVNEQAYSAGLVQHYLDSGYQAIVMDWENPAHDHPEWDSAMKYLPQRACGPEGESIPIIWNKSLAFQKFQRYVHGEMTVPEYLAYLGQHVSDKPRAFPVYGNDAEIFDFRPGRYETEAPCHPEGEWNRIRNMFEALQKDARFEWVRPRDVLELQTEPEADRPLRLESVANPVPVKKQAKYNLLRWSVTGRNDSQLNAQCWQLYEGLKQHVSSRPEDWKELCYLWSSDFRTHITQQRWDALQTRLHSRLPLQLVCLPCEPVTPDRGDLSSLVSSHWSSVRDGALLTVESDTVKIQVNCSKGLAIHGLWCKQVSDFPLLGTLPHGYFQDIAMGADFFSGHLVFECPTQPKMTDLSNVDPDVQIVDGGNVVQISGEIPSRLGAIRKELLLSHGGQVMLRYHLDWTDVPAGVLRLGHITLNPSAFEFEDLQLVTHNGGFSPEVFPLQGSSVDHGRPVSFLVSANNGFGNSEGRVVLQDRHVSVHVENSPAQGYLIPLLFARSIGSSYFCRVSFSAMEFDDTTRGIGHGAFQRSFEIRIGARATNFNRMAVGGGTVGLKENVC